MEGNSVKINALATDFVGYTDFACDAKVLAIVSADGELVDMPGAGHIGTLVLDKTPFYAQSGGQVGDSGVINNGADNAFIVADTAKNADKIFLHRGEVTRGIISVGDNVQADINAERRRSIMRNHTAAHLLQAALRQVLGTHVEQAGQLVDEREVRFDFTHFNAMTRDELLKVEHLVNAFIMGAHPVEYGICPLMRPRSWATMLFGEKYGNIVRVVKAGLFLHRVLRWYPCKQQRPDWPLPYCKRGLCGLRRAPHYGTHRQQCTGSYFIRRTVCCPALRQC